MHSVLFAVLKDDGPVEGSQYRITTWFFCIQFSLV